MSRLADPGLCVDGRGPRRFAWRCLVMLAACCFVLLLPVGRGSCAPASGTPVASRAGPTLDERSVRAWMEFLASDALRGRGSGTREEWITAVWAGAQMRGAGLEPVDGKDFLQTVDLERTEAAGQPQLSAASMRLDPKAGFVVIDAGVPQAAGPLQRFHPGVVVRRGAVLLMPGEADPRNASGLENAAMVLWHETGEIRKLWPSLAARPLTVGRTRLTGLAKPAIPAAPDAPVQIVLDDAAYAIIARLQESTVMTFRVPTRTVTSQTWNAVGQIRGTEPGQAAQSILLSAHLDHLGEGGKGPDRIYNGADDDASGTVAVLSLAQSLARQPRPRRTLVFALFGSEEVGSLGARYFLDRPTVPLSRLIANLEFEMIGRSDAAVAPHTLWLTGWERSDLGPALAAHGARLVADPHPKEHFFMRSDNYSLARRGVVAQTVSSFGLHAQYHEPDDDLAHIDIAHMLEAIRSLLGPVRWLADSDYTPAWKPGGRPAR
ncbi:MAG: M20/M25/M40 family metallo-hydrolase [Steroidobacteraceae bacterium]